MYHNFGSDQTLPNPESNWRQLHRNLHFTSILAWRFIRMSRLPMGTVPTELFDFQRGSSLNTVRGSLVYSTHFINITPTQFSPRWRRYFFIKSLRAVAYRILECTEYVPPRCPPLPSTPDPSPPFLVSLTIFVQQRTIADAYPSLKNQRFILKYIPEWCGLCENSIMCEYEDIWIG